MTRTTHRAQITAPAFRTIERGYRQELLRQLLTVHRYQLNVYGHQAFSVAGPTVRNSSRISSGTRPSVQTLSNVCLKRTCSLGTGAFSALEVLDITTLYKFTYLLTY